jgi:hypothetical protein
MYELHIPKEIESLLTLKEEMKKAGLNTTEVDEKLTEFFMGELDKVEDILIPLLKIQKEILSYIPKEEEEDETTKPKVEQEDNTSKEKIKAKLSKEPCYPVKIKTPNSGVLKIKGKDINVKFKGKQKPNQIAFIIEHIGMEERGEFLAKHVLYAGTTYLDKKIKKLYIVTKDGIVSTNLNFLSKYILSFGNEILIGDGMSIINPNFIKIKSGYDIDFV